MAIADITLLSGFEVETKDLDRVSGRLWLSLFIYLFCNCDALGLLR